MDRHLEQLLGSIIGSDPGGDLDDKKREAIMYAMLGMQSAENLRALHSFAGSISDEFKRSSVLHKLVPRLANAFQHKMAKDVADSIPLPYWRWSAVAGIASDLLEKDRASSGVNAGFRREAVALIREVEQNLPRVPEGDGDRATIVWKAGLALVEAGEFDWAERVAQSNTYCPENTEVLLRVAKARASRGDKDRAHQIIRKVAELAASGDNYLTNRAFDLKDAAELAAELGDAAEARRQLDAALGFALKSQENDIDGAKCVGLIALSLAKLGDCDAACEAAKQITQPLRRAQALQSVMEICSNTKRRPT